MIYNMISKGTASGGGYTIDQLAMKTEPSGDVVISEATAIDDNAFSGNTALVSVISDSVLVLGRSAFSSSKIQKVTLSACTRLSNNACFSWCTSLKEVHLPSLINANQTYVFQGCASLETVDYGSADVINNGVFQNNNKLQTLILRRTSAPTPLQSNSFTNTPFNGYNGLTGTAYVPSALIESYKTATNWSTLYNNGTCNFVAIEGSIYE